MPIRLPRRTLVLSGLLLGAALPARAQPVPPPIPQQGADCSRPQYASDTLICGDAELRAVDAEVARLAVTTVSLAPAAIWEDEASWMRRRSMCAFKDDHRGCLVATYADRKAVLVAASVAATGPLLCSGPWKDLRVTGSAAAPGQPVTLRQDARLLGVASPASRLHPPLLAWQPAGRGIKIQVEDGRQFKCRPAPG
jgi:hypothetical protein